MGYNIGQLYDRFHDLLHTQRTVDVYDVRDWLEEAQLEIAKLYGKVSSQTVSNAVANTPVDLASGCLGVVEVRPSGTGYRAYRNYRVTPYDQIIFLDSGTYTVHYFSVPATLTMTGTETVTGVRALELEVHDVFHLSTIDYLLFRYWDKNSEGESAEKQYAEVFHNKFRQEIAQSATILRSKATVGG